ncbi:uncharacterized protein [Argopecten irradians]|uniref:uncharacterized protein n=1 Tax=Argopecten irradians TaxID=31199 RepID=UPI00371A1D5E
MSSILTCVLFGVLIGLVCCDHHNDHHCYNCFHATSPHDCTDMLSCPHGKECFTTYYTGPDGGKYYHLGCASHGACIHSANFDPHTHGWIYPYAHHEVLCGHCCTEPGCNQNTCDPTST